MALLGSLIAAGAALAFAAIGLLCLWGGWATLRDELPRDFVRTRAAAGSRSLTLLLLGLAIGLTALFGLLAAGRILLLAAGLG